jgi:adenylate cyclase
MPSGSSQPTGHQYGDPVQTPALLRRLAAVVFIDVVGYTKLMEFDEVGTHQRWMTLRQSEIEPRVKERSGAIVKSTGDGLLLEFPSAREAVDFALDVQRHLASSRSSYETAPLQTRMAANIVDIIPERDDIYGDGVNIAARLLAFADPGGIVISASLEEQVRGQLAYRTADLGFLTVKNVERRIRAFKIAPTELAPPRPPPSRHHKPSVAVLPLHVLSTDQSDAYRSAGLVHEIVASLAGLRELFVVSNHSTVAFTETTLDPGAICNQLGVRYLLAGTLIRDNGRLKVRFELSDNDLRTVIWTDQHELSAPDFFGLQAAIAIKVAYALLPHIRSQELQKALRKRPENLDSYDLTLRALYRLYRLTEEDFKASRQLLESAIEHDPHNAMAYALMAKWYILRIGEGHSSDFNADSQSALDFASRALEHDASDPLALAIFGHVRSFLFADYERAIEAFDRAILASPNSAIAWGLSAPTYCYIGDGKQGVMRAAHAMALSPLDPYAYFYRAAHCLANYVDDNFEEAVLWGRRTMAAAPGYTASMRPLIASLVALQRIPEAQEVAAIMMRLDPGFRVDQFCSWYPLKDPDRRALFARRLRDAGLPG